MVIVRKGLCKKCEYFSDMKIEKVGSRKQKGRYMVLFIFTCPLCKVEKLGKISLSDWDELMKDKENTLPLTVK